MKIRRAKDGTPVVVGTKDHRKGRFPGRPKKKEELRVRHARGREALRLALAGRRTGVLKELKRRHWLVEDETRRILDGMKEET